jgi:transcriptional regulator with XRE-family HTH domain
MARMDGRKFDWIRKQLGLSKVELAKRLGISRQSLYRCIWDGPPKLVALAILGLWYQDRMGGLLEEASEPEEKTVQKPRGEQGNRRSNKRE